MPLSRLSLAVSAALLSPSTVSGSVKDSQVLLCLATAAWRNGGIFFFFHDAVTEIRNPYETGELIPGKAGAAS